MDFSFLKFRIEKKKKIEKSIKWKVENSQNLNIHKIEKSQN